MAQPLEKRTITVRGKGPTTFSTRRLKDGTIAYYRAGKRQTTPSQIRATRGVLKGQTLQEARGKAPPEIRRARANLRQRGLLPTSTQALKRQGPEHIEKWGRSFNSAKPNQEYDWYAQVEIQAFKGQTYDLEDVDPDETRSVTILLARGATKTEITRNLDQTTRQALDSYGLTPAKDQPVTAVWRKKD